MVTSSSSANSASALRRLSICGCATAGTAIFSGTSGCSGTVVSTCMNSFGPEFLLARGLFGGAAFEQRQRHASGFLLRFFLAAAFGGRQPGARMPNFHFEYFLVIRAGFAVHPVLHRRATPLLQPFLQRGLVVGALDSVSMRGKRGRQQSTLQEGRGRGQTRVQINRTENCFKNIREQAALIAAAGLFFTCAQTQVGAELQALGGGVQRSGADQACEPLGKLARIPVRIRLAKIFTDNQTKNPIAEEFETFIVRPVGQLTKRTVGDGPLEQIRSGEMVTDDGLQVAALVIAQVS